MIIPSFNCSGEAAAHDAANHDLIQCALCQNPSPGGDVRHYPEGPLCETCHQETEDGEALDAWTELRRRVYGGE